MHEKLKFEQIKKDSCASLRYDYSSLYPKDEMPLHFHPEIEICYVVKGSGYRMIGDFLEPFEEGEVVLVPTNQPHCWMYNPESCEPDGKRRCIVVQFNPDLLQTGLSFFTEWEYAAHRLSAIQQGILLTGETAGKIKSCLEEMNLLNASERMLMLIRILQQIGTTTDLIPIGLQETVFKYVIEHYKEKITLSDAANVISMSTTAFCSFFKRETGKTFTNFINEYRIEAVGTLLRNFPDKDINEIAWQCGFTDIPYFNRYFKKMKQMTPKQWRYEIEYPNMNAEIIRFLDDLRRNNNTVWFHENRERYDKLRCAFINEVQELIERISVFDPDIRGLDARKCLFRINRDIRFSLDKSPYKTYMSACIAQGGRHSIRGAYYFHLEPEYCVLSGGIWYPKPEILKVLRREIYNNIDEFVSIIEEPSFKALYPSLEGDMLKRIPAGFPSDSPYSHILRHKDFSVIGIKPDSFFSQPDWMEETIDCFRKLLPFNRFLNEIVDEYMGNL